MLKWNPHSRNADGSFRTARIEGDYMGVKMERNRAYQFDGVGNRTFGHSITPSIFTGIWTGMMDDGVPIFQHVDTHQDFRTPRNATFFEELSNV